MNFSFRSFLTLKLDRYAKMAKNIYQNLICLLISSTNFQILENVTLRSKIEKKQLL